jgi:hypothetical protein
MLPTNHRSTSRAYCRVVKDHSEPPRPADSTWPSWRPLLRKINVERLPRLLGRTGKAFPGNGKLFPNGSKIVKIEWLLKKNTASPCFVNVPEHAENAGVYRERQQAIPRHPGLGLRRFSQ